MRSGRKGPSGTMVPRMEDTMAKQRTGYQRAPGTLAALLVLNLLGGEILYSAPATSQQASNAAMSFLAMRYPSPVANTARTTTTAARSPLAVKSVQALTDGGRTLGYLARLDPGGYVLLRGDLEAPPVKLHSDSGEFEALPPVFTKVILLELAEELEYLRESAAPPSTVASPYSRQWTAPPSSTKGKLALAGAPVEDANTVLLTTTWNQGTPYNYYCPSASGGPGGKAWAGCGATALAQVLRYHGSPVQVAGDHAYTDSSGTCKGTHSLSDAGLGPYDWANMPSGIDASSSTAQRLAVAQLIYHCAVAMASNFEGSGTGTGPSSTVAALSEQFGYSSGGYETKSSYTSSQWYDKVAASIDADKPIFYALWQADWSAGHAVVCDGYRNGNEIHLNLGWSGSGNAWYNIDSVKSTYTWTIHGAVFGITPPNGVPPQFTVQPQNLTNAVGSPVTLSVNATGTPAPKFQWRKAGKNLAGQTAADLVFTSLTLADAAKYDVVAKNSYGNATSGPVTLTVVDTVRITQQPAGVVAKNGTTVTFAVQATPAVTTTFQWKLDGIPLANATSNRLTLTRVGLGQEGSYSVTVSNLAGAVDSRTAKLAVLLPPTLTLIPKSMTGDEGAGTSASVTADGRDPLTYTWFKTGNKVPLQTGAAFTLSNLGTNDKGSYFVVITNTDGKLTSAAVPLILNEVPRWTASPKKTKVIENGKITFSGAASGVKPITYYWYGATNLLGITTNASFSLTKVQTNLECAFTAVASNRLGTATSATFDLYVVDAPAITQIPKSVTGDEGGDVEIAVTATGREPLSYTWYKTGVKTILQTGATLTLSTLSTNEKGSFYVVITNVDGKITSPAVALALNEKPRWTASPKYTKVLENGKTTLSGTATGVAPMAYYWLGGTNFLGVTSKPTITLTNVLTNLEGSFQVTASNRLGTATSAAFDLYVSDPPAVVQIPKTVVVDEGGDLRIPVTASGRAPLSYAWLKIGSKTVLGTEATLVLTQVANTNAGSYSVVITNVDGKITSTAVSVTINELPRWVTVPKDIAVLRSNTLTLTASAKGAAPISYLWYANGSWVNTTTKGTLTIPTIPTNSAGAYFVIASNRIGTATSPTFQVKVSDPPLFTKQPVGGSVKQEGTLTLSAEVMGKPPFTYVWKKNNVAIAGATESSLVIANAQTPDAGAYKVVASNDDGTKESAAATVTVIAKPVFTLQPAGVTGTNGQKISLAATVTGTGLTYQWQRDGANVAGATAATCKLTLGASTTGSYVLIAKNAWGTVASDAAVVAIAGVSAVSPGVTCVAGPQVTRQPETWLSWSGGDVTFAPEIAGTTGETRYQWYHDGEAVAGGTSPTLTVSDVQPADGGQYHLAISDSGVIIATEAGELLVARNVTESRIVQAAPGEILALAHTRGKMPILLFRAETNRTYGIERSVDGRAWQGIAGGTPESPVSQFIDETVAPTAFYRISVEPKQR